MKQFLIISIILLSSCSTYDRKKDVEFDILTAISLERSVIEINNANKELSQLVSNSDFLRNIVQNTLDTLFQLEEDLIAMSGGYKTADAALQLDRRNLISTELRDGVQAIRNNSYGVTKEWLNRTYNYLESQGFKSMPTVIGPTDDPYSRMNPQLQGLDFFDIVFSDRNLYQIFITLTHLKLNILQLERDYLQSQLFETNSKTDSL